MLWKRTKEEQMKRPAVRKERKKTPELYRSNAKRYYTDSKMTVNKKK